MNSSSTPIGIHVASLPLVEVVPVFFFLVFFVWLVYTLVAVYHWLRYANNTTLGLCAITAHLIVSAWLALYTVSGLVH